LPTGPE
jgi:AcrR family transcriptional regulator